jgi:hypothetical protein
MTPWTVCPSFWARQHASRAGQVGAPIAVCCVLLSVDPAAWDDVEAVQLDSPGHLPVSQGLVMG